MDFSPTLIKKQEVLYINICNQRPGLLHPSYIFDENINIKHFLIFLLDYNDKILNYIYDSI